MTIEHAKAPGEVTRINVLKGQFRVSNVFHKHSGVVLIQIGDNAFELNRGAALISNTGTGPKATLLHGKSLGIQGTRNKLTTPGMRFKIPQAGGAAQRERPDASSINAMMNRVSGRSRPLGHVRRGPDGQKRIINRSPRRKEGGSRIIQRVDIQNQTKKIQGAGLPSAVQLIPPPRPPYPPYGGHPPHHPRP